MAYMSFIERLGMEKGLQLGLLQGMEKGEATLLVRLLINRFGELPISYRRKIEQANSQTLLSWADRLFNAETLVEVFRKN